MLDRVLGGDDEERPLQRIGPVVHAHLPLGHAFEEGRLGARSGAVDLVRQQDLGEDGAGVELEVARLLVEDARPRDVARQQVGRALQPAEPAAERARQGLGEERLGRAGDVLQQEVPLGEQAGEHQLEHRPLAVDDRLELLEDGLGGLLDLFHHTPRIGRTWMSVTSAVRGRAKAFSTIAATSPGRRKRSGS